MFRDLHGDYGWYVITGVRRGNYLAHCFGNAWMIRVCVSVLVRTHLHISNHFSFMHTWGVRVGFQRCVRQKLKAPTCIYSDSTKQYYVLCYDKVWSFGIASPITVLVVLQEVFVL
jgi:hypothetical protein